MNQPRNVVHFSTADNDGGSGRAAYRIHKGLREAGWKSRMLVGRKGSEDPDVDTVFGASQASKWSGYVLDKLTRRLGFSDQWYPWSYRLSSHPWIKDADIFQLFNLHGGYFPIRLLPVLSRHGPIIWRLSDMWPMTGHCVYSGDCERWKIGCGKCPSLQDYVEIGIDTSALLWRQKSKLYAECDITVVAPSSWIERLAKESPLLGQFPVRRIPNGLDTKVFRPIRRSMACDVMGFDPNIKRILFVAHGLDNNLRKGGPLLMEVLRLMGRQPGVELLLAGVGGGSWQQAELPVPIRYAGYITDDRLMAAMYSCADIVVVPSTAENLPNTLLEAMACGLPAVALNVGGMKDAVCDGVTGYLVDPEDIAGFSRRVKELLNNNELRKNMGVKARHLIETEFAISSQTERFNVLYEEVLVNRSQFAT